MAERDDAPLADDTAAGVPPNDGPSGLPEGADEVEPLGSTEEPNPEGEGDTPRGEEAQPGLNREEPDVSG
jgi:hypothetical protein